MNSSTPAEIVHDDSNAADGIDSVNDAAICDSRPIVSCLVLPNLSFPIRPRYEILPPHTRGVRPNIFV